MHFVYTGSLLLVPLSYAELPLGIQIKNSNDQKIESARGKMGGGEKTSLLLFSHHIFPAHFSFFPLPILHPSLRHNEVSVGERSRAVRARNKWWSKSSPLKDLVTARKGCHTNQRPSSNIGEYRF